MNSTIFIHQHRLFENVSAIKNKLESDVKVMAVIKDNAYGHGFDGIASALYSKVDWFCVARAEEGIHLRKIGIKNPILVFEIPNHSTRDIFPNHDLTATVADLESLDILSSGTKYHINLDTGMHRLGILPCQVSKLLSMMSVRTDIEATGIYTHFFKSDDPGNPEVQAQLNMFKELRSKFDSQLMTHVANSGAIFHYSHLDVQFDAVRPGVSLFGYGAGEKNINSLKPIIEWNTFLMQVKPVKKGGSVSYGGQWIAPCDGFIGVIPVGYSSGLRRDLSSQLEFEIAGKLYNQVGIISMDYSMVFLNQDKLGSGTQVNILNLDILTAKNWAEKAKTISYEITTGINPMIERKFI